MSACKQVTVNLYDSGNNLVGTAVIAAGDPSHNFIITPVDPGTYNAEAKAEGFLRAEGSATITSGGTTTMPDLTLLPGDINGENSSDADDVINQWDALTIGMNYNGTTPTDADLNNDGVINVLDLELLASSYRETGPTVWELSYP